MQSALAAEYPSAAGQTLIAIDFWLGPAWEVALVEGDRADETVDVLRTLYRSFLPNKLVALKRNSEHDFETPPVLQPLLKGKSARGGSATVYLCQHGTCGLPLIGASALEVALRNR
jgi:uncharacterized protein YyaL (SSP411 family)